MTAVRCLLCGLLLGLRMDTMAARLSAAQRQRAERRSKRREAAQVEALQNSSSSAGSTPPHSLITWDPPELPPNWWLPLATSSSSHLPFRCPPHQPAVHMEGATGRTNNFLIVWATVLEYAVTRSPPKAVILSSAYKRFVGWRFDVKTATRSWACVIDPWEVSSINRSVEVVQGPALFRKPQNEMGATFIVTAIAQLLLRPSPTLRFAVDAFMRVNALTGIGVKQKSADTLPYVAIHVRGLEGSCEKRFERGGGFPDVVKSYDAWAPDVSGKERYTATDVCRMSVEYVRAVFRAEGIAWVTTEANATARTARTVLHRVVICHDGQDKKAVHALQNFFSARAYKPSLQKRDDEMTSANSPLAKQRLEEVDGAAVDALLMLKSSFFIGNPASSFSRNVAAVRRHQLRTHSRSNLWGVPPKDYD